MHIGALGAYFMDARVWRSHWAAICTAHFGFEEHPSGALTWRFEQRPVEDDVGHLQGPVVDLLRIVGMPFSRCAAAAACSARWRGWVRGLGGLVGSTILATRCRVALLRLRATSSANAHATPHLGSFRAGIPEELLDGRLTDATGRRRGLAADALVETMDITTERIRVALGRTPTARATICHLIRSWLHTTAAAAASVAAIGASAEPFLA